MRKPGLARAAALLVVLTAGSQLLGFVRDAVIAAVFGVGADLDAYLVAQGAMNLVLALIAGAMAKAIVPTVSRAAAADDHAAANRAVQTALTLTVLILLAGGTVMFFAAEQVVAVLAPGFDPDTAKLCVDLTRVMLLAVVFIAATNILAAASEAHGRFFLSGFQGTPFNLVMIAAALWFGAQYGVRALAVGFVVGSAVRLLVQLPAVRAAELRLRPRLALRHPDIREMLKLAPPILLSAAVVNVNTLVDRAVGSSIGEGTIAALNFGWRVVTLVDTLLVVTFAAALYPAFSAVGTPDRREELRDLVGRALSVMLVLLAPIVVVLIIAAEPVVTLVFGRGGFDADAIDLTSTAVVAFAVSAGGLGLRVITTRAFFAVGDSRTPVLVALVSMAINVVGDLTLGVRYGVAGIAASTSISLLVGAALLVVLLGRRHAGVSLPKITATAARVLLAAGIAGVIAASLSLDELVPGTGHVAAGVHLALAGVIVGGAYLGMLLALRSQELHELWQLIRLRLLSGGRRLN